VFAVSGTYSHRSNVAAQHDRERGPACTHVEHAHPSTVSEPSHEKRSARHLTTGGYSACIQEGSVLAKVIDTGNVHRLLDYS
jgi:hypothetical protein